MVEIETTSNYPSYPPISSFKPKLWHLNVSSQTVSLIILTSASRLLLTRVRVLSTSTRSDAELLETGRKVACEVHTL